jgi:putative methyltransferase
MKKNILISQPNLSTKWVWAPYIYMALKTYADTCSNLANNFHWLDPIWNPGDPADILQPYAHTKIDVLGLSCYEWNYDLQVALAQMVREKNPDCLIVMGGPQPDYKDSNFFIGNDFLDLVVIQEGEKVFSDILESYLMKEGFEHIPGLCINPKHVKDHKVVNTPPKRLDSFHLSPYLAQEEYFKTFLKLNHNKKINVFWETNRGCPYGCVFCDWGSLTVSKIIKFDMDILQKEIQFFEKYKVDVVHITDPNFGILDRDVEIARLLSEAKDRSGWPKRVVWTNSKSNIDNNLKIARELFKSGLITSYALPLQSTNTDVLRISKRLNVTDGKLRKLISGLNQSKIPITAQLILGQAGDTPEIWLATLTDMFELGVHDEIHSQPFSLLPNSPANSIQFKTKYKIDTIRRLTHLDFVRRWTGDNPQEHGYSFYVCETYSYNRDQWVEMILIDTVVKCLHNFGITQNLSKFLRYTHGISYFIFYQRLLVYLEKNNSNLMSILRDHISKFAYQKDSILEMDLFRNSSIKRVFVQPEEWLFVKLFEADIFDQLIPFCQTLITDKTSTEVIDYSRTTLVSPRECPTTTRKVALKRNWPGYFQIIDDSPYNFELEAPKLFKMPVSVTATMRSTGGKSWANSKNCQIRQLKYVVQMLGENYARSKNNLLILNLPS